MIGRPNVDSTSIYLDKRDAFKILNLTFEEQVNTLKIESTEILNLYFKNNKKIKLVDFYLTIIK